MSSNRKALKVLSLIQFVLSICVIILAVLSKIGGGEAVEAKEWGEAARLYLDLPAFAVFGILSIAGSVTGIHGANRPSALGSHRLLCILGVIFGIVAMIVSGAGAGVPVVPCITVVVNAAAAVFDTKVRKELDERR